MPGPDPHARVAIITGASAGLGLATAAGLAAVGLTVVMVCRAREPGEAAREAVVARTGNRSVELALADLGSLESVRRVAAELTAKHPRLHLLVNNAAVMLGQRRRSPDGHELMFATNHLGPFLLTHQLLEALTLGAPARILNVSAPSTVRPDFDDLDGERKFDAVTAFGASKTANLLFTYELARRVKDRGLTVNACHPGLVRTGLMRNAPGPMRVFGGLLNLVAAPPERAAQALVRLATASEFDGVTGQLIHNGRTIKAPFVDDREAQAQLWQRSLEMTGARSEFT